MSVGDVAGYDRGVCSLCFQRTAVQSAGGHFRLLDTAVRLNGYLLGASLPAVVGLVGQSVVENVPLTVNIFNASVGSACHV